MADISSGAIIIVVISSVLGVVLGQFLTRLFMKGDKTDSKTLDLELRVAKIESDRQSDQELQWYKMREHVGSEYATRTQVEALSSKLDNTLGRIERMIVPVFRRMYPDASVPE